MPKQSRKIIAYIWVIKLVISCFCHCQKNIFFYFIGHLANKPTLSGFFLRRNKQQEGGQAEIFSTINMKIGSRYRCLSATCSLSRKKSDLSQHSCFLLSMCAVLCVMDQVTNNRDDIEIAGGGLPLWDPSKTNNPAFDNGRPDSCSPNRSTNTTPSYGLEDDALSSFGSMFLTCNVVFPETMGRSRVQHVPLPPWNLTSNQY